MAKELMFLSGRSPMSRVMDIEGKILTLERGWCQTAKVERVFDKKIFELITLAKHEAFAEQAAFNQGNWGAQLAHRGRLTQLISQLDHFYREEDRKINSEIARMKLQLELAKRQVKELGTLKRSLR